MKKVKVKVHKLLLSLYLSIVILILLLFSDGNKNVTSVLLPILAANQLIHDIGDSKVTDGELNAGGQKLNTNALKMESMHCYKLLLKKYLLIYDTYFPVKRWEPIEELFEFLEFSNLNA